MKIRSLNSGDIVKKDFKYRAYDAVYNKFGRATMYVSALFVVAVIASLGYKSPVDISENKSTNASLTETQVVADIAKPSVDQISVANLAAKVADTANLTVSTEVFSQYVTLSAQQELAQTASEAVVTKPQVFEVAATRGFETHKAAAGDTVTALAERYKVSAETIRWANNLASDALSPDQELIIPPIDGVVYTTKEGDSLDALAQKYQSDAARIVSQNDLELTGLAPNTRLIIPGGVLPETERPGYVAPRASVASTGSFYSSSYGVQAGNRYSYGYCTWYVYNRRAELGMPIGSLWGHAANWANAARSLGYQVDRTPTVGAIMQDSSSAGGYGHVAVVARIFEDGSFRVSEMNYGGWNVLSSRTVPAGAAIGYNFIH